MELGVGRQEKLKAKNRQLAADERGHHPADLAG